MDLVIVVTVNEALNSFRSKITLQTSMRGQAKVVRDLVWLTERIVLLKEEQETNGNEDQIGRQDMGKSLGIGRKGSLETEGGPKIDPS